MKLSKKQLGIVALLGYAFLASTMGILVREMDTVFTSFQQVYLRAFIGFLFAVLIYRKRINIQKFKKLQRKQWGILLLRSLSLYVFGVVLFSKSIVLTTYSNVNFIFAIPFTAILGFLLLKERLNIRKSILVLLAFVGVLIISVEDFTNIFSVGLGETLAFISAFFYSFSSILRKFQSKELNNQEITVAMLLIGSTMVFITSIFTGNDFTNFVNITPSVLIALVIAGLWNTLMGLFINYGFSKIDAVVAGNIIFIETVFAVLISIIVYKEFPDIFEWLGALLVILSAYWMNKESGN
ncbi:EamA family transporter [Candidatus Dojkabacteria bacterium]|nr:EamA family transporter [Candidatus Dojkabacteria bacterium]